MQKNNFLTFFLLILSTYSYTLLGPYKLQLDNTFKNISSNASIIFDFKKQIVNKTGFLSISNTVSVFACSVIDFSVQVQDSNINFMLKDIGVNRRQCVKDQAGELITRMNKVAFHTIIADSLLFLSASGKIQLKLLKIQTGKYKDSLAGVWQVYQIQYMPASTILKSNDSVMQLCNGNAVIDYRISSRNKINQRIRSVSNCSQNNVLNGIYNSQYIRNFNDQLWFYDRQVGLIMKWNSLGYLPGNREILYPKPTNLVQNSNMPNLSANGSPGNNSTQINKDTNDNLNKIAANISTVAADANNNISAINKGAAETNNVLISTIRSAGQSTSKPDIKIDKNKQANPPLSETKNSNIPPSSQNTASVLTEGTVSLAGAALSSTLIISNTPPISPPTTALYLLRIKKQDISTKWYFMNTQVETMMVIASNRILIYGDCGVWYTVFNTKDTQDGKLPLFNNKANNTLPTCLGQNNPLQFLLTYTTYITMREDGKKRYLGLYNKDNNKLNQCANFKQK